MLFFENCFYVCVYVKYIFNCRYSFVLNSNGILSYMIVLLRKDSLPDDDAMISFALRHRKQKTKDQPLVEIM